jgi:hypothetical protein
MVFLTMITLLAHTVKRSPADRADGESTPARLTVPHVQVRPQDLVEKSRLSRQVGNKRRDVHLQRKREVVESVRTQVLKKGK